MLTETELQIDQNTLKKNDKAQNPKFIFEN